MAARRAPSICLACQARQAVVGRRRPTTLSKGRRLETLALVPAGTDGGIAIATTTATFRPSVEAEAEHMHVGVTVCETLPAWKLDEQPSDVREAFRSLEDLWKTKHLRIPILSGLSNPWPKERHSGAHSEKRLAKTKVELPDANAAPISHPNFRSSLFLARSDKLTRQVLRAQLLRCQTPSDIFRVVAAALTTSRQSRLSIAALHEPIVRALYRCRDHVDDAEVLRAVNGIYSRYQVYGIHFDDQLLAFGLKFAARVRTLKGMKKYLRAIRDRNIGMTSNVFRATIAKFSIGHRGLGEIRNGRWLRSELLQVLVGFDDCTHLPPDQQYHLRTFLDRNDWQYLHGWIAALARCKHVEEIWREWVLWKGSEARKVPKNLASISPLTTTKTRGDYWFVEQMTYSGGMKEAWKIVEETDTNVALLKDRIQSRLLEGVEFCPRSVWQAQGQTIRHQLIRKYDLELSKIERALSIAWVPTDLDDDAEGYHVLSEDQETVVIERLANENFKLEDDFGYPYESIMPPKERSLHDAVEVHARSDGEQGH